MKYSSIVLILASAISMVSCTSSQQEVVPTEEPYWKFKDCILGIYSIILIIFFKVQIVLWKVLFDACDSEKFRILTYVEKAGVFDRIMILTF